MFVEKPGEVRGSWSKTFLVSVGMGEVLFFPEFFFRWRWEYTFYNPVVAGSYSA